MKRFCVLLLLLLCIPGCAERPAEDVIVPDGPRWTIALDAGWEFLRQRVQPGEEGVRTDWKEVSLPHTWNAKDGQDGGADYHRGYGSYQRTLHIPSSFSGRRVFLHFDGAATVTQVFINGTFAGEHRGNYAAFRFDITDALEYGADNQLLVRVNNEADDSIAPLSADFTFFGGLYRRVRLISTEPVHVDMLDYASAGVYWRQQVSDERAELQFRSRVVNARGEGRELDLRSIIRNAEGQVVASTSDTISIPGNSELDVTADLVLDTPHLWQGVEDPYLYQADFEIHGRDAAGELQLLDRVRQPLGLRYFSVDNEQGLSLNGRPWPLYGINLMSDRPGKGTALSPDDHEEDLQLIMELGARGIRLGHQQRDAWVYQRASELGLVVWAEVPLINRISDTDEFRQNVRQQALELVRQNYNHPAILFWGLYNEITLKPGPDPRPLVQELSALVKAEDPDRLTTAAAVVELVDREALQDPLVRATDLTSFNRYYGWYHGDFRDLDEFLDGTREAAPELRFGLGEFGAGAGANIHSSEPRMQDHSEEYQALFHEHYWDSISQRPWLWGNFIWVLADFAVDNRDEGEVPGRNDKGLVTFDRKVRKDAFYWYKANWSAEPVLHITGRRFVERSSETIELKVYSNLQQLEVFLNGTRFARQDMQGQRRVSWQDVPLQMGENRILVKGLDVRGAEHKDEIVLQRVNSRETSVSSSLLGIDSRAGTIYNLPAGTSVTALGDYLEFPAGSRYELSGLDDAEAIVSGSVLRVTAQDGVSTQDYRFRRAPISVAKTVSANKENRNAFKVGPVSVPEMSARMANDGLRTAPGSGVTEVNIWNTMQAEGPAWWKVDLGSSYYIDSIELAWPENMDTLVEGVMRYRIEVAGEFEQTFDQFSETYAQVVDRSDNEELGSTRDELGVQARFVKITLLESGIRSKVPVVGEFPIYGAEEFTVVGGLLFSDSVAVDYLAHTVTVTGAGASYDELAAALSVVEGGRLEFLDAGGVEIAAGDTATPVATVIAYGSDDRLYEHYTVQEKQQ